MSIASAPNLGTRKMGGLDILGRIFAGLQATGEIPGQISVAPGLEQSSLEDLGLDSVAIVALMAAIEEEIGLVLDESNLTRESTIGEVAVMIEDKRRP